MARLIATTPIQPGFEFDKRWKYREQRWVAPGPLFDPCRYGVELTPERDAKRFTIEHHYSGSYPASRLAVGLYRLSAARLQELVGVAVFSVPMQQAVIPRYTGLEPRQGAELGRFVLLDELPYNSESWFLRRAFQALKATKPEIRSIVSFADPLGRLAGTTPKKPHWGVIYAASNALYAGQSRPAVLQIAPNGQLLSQRALSKIRLDEIGRAYAERQLVAAGAPPREAEESSSIWLERALAHPGFHQLRHPGNHVYVFGLDAAARAAARAANPTERPYPKPRAA
jgi:hypothetical protein